MPQGQALRLVRVSLLNQLSQGRVTYVDLCLIRDLLRGVTTDVSYGFNNIYVTVTLW